MYYLNKPHHAPCQVNSVWQFWLKYLRAQSDMVLNNEPIYSHGLWRLCFEIHYIHMCEYCWVKRETRRNNRTQQNVPHCSPITIKKEFPELHLQEKSTRSWIPQRRSAYLQITRNTQCSTVHFKPYPIRNGYDAAAMLARECHYYV